MNLTSLCRACTVVCFGTYGEGNGFSRADPGDYAVAGSLGLLELTYRGCKSGILGSQRCCVELENDLAHVLAAYRNGIVGVDSQCT